MEFVVYILENPDGKFYIGQTSNLGCRLATHNSGKSNYTSRYNRPWKLVYSEIFPTRGDAMERERHLKKQKGGDTLKKIIKNGL